VKQARVAAGLSLGQVARDDISRTAIYFVETGKAKPSVETLQLIAERTGHPVEFFLEDGAERTGSAVRLLELERLLAQGDNLGAIASGKAALAHRPDPETEARINLLMSMAHNRLAQPVLGRRLAVAARTYFERVGDLVMTAECLGNEAASAYLMEDPNSVRIAEGALATVRSIKPVPRLTEARLLGVLGHALLNNHQWEAAIESYEQAIATSDVVQDLKSLSLFYSGLSWAHEEIGQLDRAGHFAQKALTIHETLKDRLSLARSENNLGLLILHSGEVARAEPHLQRAYALYEESGVQVGLANMLLSLAELAAARRDFTRAEELCRQALDGAEYLGETATVAEAHYQLAMVAQAKGDQPAVDAEFAAALSNPHLVGGAQRIARYRSSYAEILEARGDLAAANRQLRSALAELGARPAAESVGQAAIA